MVATKRIVHALIDFIEVESVTIISIVQMELMKLDASDVQTDIHVIIMRMNSSVTLVGRSVTPTLINATESNVVRMEKMKMSVYCWYRKRHQNQTHL